MAAKWIEEIRERENGGESEALNVDPRKWIDLTDSPRILSPEELSKIKVLTEKFFSGGKKGGSYANWIITSQSITICALSLEIDRLNGLVGEAKISLEHSLLCCHTENHPGSYGTQWAGGRCPKCITGDTLLTRLEGE